MLTTKNPFRVDFQDYNQQVLKLVTIPNILLNTVLCPRTEDFSNGIAEVDVPEHANLLDQLKKSRFFAGDWSGLTASIYKENLLVILRIMINVDSNRIS